MKIEIEQDSGFCFGVVRVIEIAEKILKKEGRLFCLGDIVHNSREVERLKKKGLRVIGYQEFNRLKDCKVLIRAHGEPPGTYLIAKENNIELIDGTCPVVLKLQQRIQEKYEELKTVNGQIVVYGKKGHAEVRGLSGHTDNKAIIIESPEDLQKIDTSRPLHIFSQTTKSLEDYQNIIGEIKKIYKSGSDRDIYLHCTNSICAQVSRRAPKIREFCKNHDVIIFVSGKRSSNGKILFGECRKVNGKSYFVSGGDEIKDSWFADAKSVGICGATSTPKWLMEEISEIIKKLSAINNS
ncbi:MAG: 4-hydroxy-3-methylbut-2-enyl diphosphate reductase [Bacteroidales bacterium]|nr:4-hydroxy-3-methylbut-2-enyl diphosphate reductase [Bacteroidales bacterium]